MNTNVAAVPFVGRQCSDVVTCSVLSAFTFKNSAGDNGHSSNPLETADSTGQRTKLLEFPVRPLSSTARSRLRASGKEAAAARSTRLRPIHFIHFIAAAVINRGPNLFRGMHNHYKFVMFGKRKIFAANFTFALRF